MALVGVVIAVLRLWGGKALEPLEKGLWVISPQAFQFVHACLHLIIVHAS